MRDQEVKRNIARDGCWESWDEPRKRGVKALMRQKRMGCSECFKMMRVQEFAGHRRNSCPKAKLI